MRGLPLSRIALAAVRGRSGAPYCPPADFYVLALQSCLLIQRITAGRGGVWAMVYTMAASGLRYRAPFLRAGDFCEHG